MRVRTKRDGIKERGNDRPPCKLGDAQLAHFESEPRRHRDDLPGVTGAGSEGTIQVDKAESAGGSLVPDVCRLRAVCVSFTRRLWHCHAVWGLVVALVPCLRCWCPKRAVGELFGASMAREHSHGVSGSRNLWEWHGMGAGGWHRMMERDGKEKEWRVRDWPPEVRLKTFQP